MKRVRWGFAVFGALMMLLSGVADGALLLPVSGDKLGAGGHLRMHRSVAVDSAAPDSALWVTSGGETRVHSLRINGALLTKTPTEIDKLSSVVAVDASAPNGSISVSSSGVVSVNSINLTEAALFYGLQGSCKNLMLSTTGLSDVVTVTADAVVLMKSDYRFYLAKNIILSLHTTTSGLGGLDNGSIAYGVWYYVYVISDGVSVNGLLSASSTYPVLPSGYTFFARVGAIRTQSATYYYPLSIIQSGRLVYYKLASGSNVTSLPTMVTGTATLWTAIAIEPFVPPTARRIFLSVNVSQSAPTSQALAAPSNAYSTSGGASGGWGNIGVATTGAYGNFRMEFLIESSNIYWGANNSANSLRCLGWEDSF